jgi:hypothetical protein
MNINTDSFLNIKNSNEFFFNIHRFPRTVFDSPKENILTVRIFPAGKKIRKPCLKLVEIDFGLLD